MTLKIYGTPRSRTMRVLWAAAELGVDYDHVPLALDDPELKSPGFLRINPAGAVPAIVDDGFALAESMAIILYLAKKHAAAGLYPAGPEGEAEAWRWSLWAQGHIEPWVQRDASVAPMRAALGGFARSGWRPHYRCWTGRSPAGTGWSATASRSPTSTSPACCRHRGPRPST